MSLVNKDAILNSNPKKKLFIGFENLKENFTKEAALDYSELYNKQPLSFILENSEKIFSEPYYGYEFYKNIVAGRNEFGIFHEYKNEKEKIETYLENHRDDMNEDQIAMYESLVSSLSDKISNNKNTIMVAEYTMEQHEDNQVVLRMLDYIYEASLDSTSVERREELDDLIAESVNNFIDDKRYFIYGPVICSNFSSIGAINTFIECANDLTPESVTENPKVFGEFMEDIYCVHKMMNDIGYRCLLSDIPSRDARLTFEAFGEESLSGILEQLMTEETQEVNTYYTNPRNAVNNIFDDIMETKLFNDEFTVIKTRNDGLRKAAYESVSNLLLFEYQTCDDPSIDSCCDLVKEGTSIEEAALVVSRMCDQVKSDLGILTEADEDDDEDDDDFDEFEKNLDKDDKDTDTSKKDKAPAPKSVADAIQIKAMDAEAKQMKRLGEHQKRGLSIRGAAKAVTNLPSNVIKSIKSLATKADLKSAEKRKNEMKAPGYKNKIFRNLKLAIMYGTVAQVRLALIPVTIFLRHFAKERDRRLRNELISELDTEIKICDEKINDAGGAGDNKEKYQLMRIKSELERERLRVRTNSKYI